MSWQFATFNESTQTALFSDEYFWDYIFPFDEVARYDRKYNVVNGNEYKKDMMEIKGIENLPMTNGDGNQWFTKC